jgi:hypothetical protein
MAETYTPSRTVDLTYFAQYKDEPVSYLGTGRYLTYAKNPGELTGEVEGLLRRRHLPADIGSPSTIEASSRVACSAAERLFAVVSCSFWGMPVKNRIVLEPGWELKLVAKGSN